jgi:hypothetical protein
MDLTSSIGDPMMQRSFQILLLLFAAAVTGFVAAGISQTRAPSLPGPLYRVESITASPEGFEVTLDRGTRFRIDTLQNLINARNIVLLYPGKSITLTREGTDPNRVSGDAQCEWIVPLLEQNPDSRTAERYRQLREPGVVDASIAARSAPPAQDVDREYMRRSICAVRQ